MNGDQMAPPARRDAWLDIWCLLAGVLLLRDSTMGALRFYLNNFGLGPLWFVPDVAAFGALIWFVRDFVIRRRSLLASVFFLNVLVALAVGIVFMSSGISAIISSIKMILPLFLGFVFCGQSLTARPWSRNLILFTLFVSITGLVIAPYVNFPWNGATIDSFGISRPIARLWWAQGVIRHGGFAGDNVSAAFSCFFLYLLVHPTLSRRLNMIIWIPLFVAISNSTSKTVLICLCLFIAYYLTVHFLRPVNDHRAVARKFAIWSFLAVPLPFILMVTVSGFDLQSVNAVLYSIQDRINNTWQFPFSYFSENFPMGLLSGCGLGCFTYPMFYTELASISVPVDSFYIASYVMFGAPFLIVVSGMFTAAFKSDDIAKLTLIAVFNVYSVTVQSYTPSISLMLLGYAFSDMYLSRTPVWRRLASIRVAPTGRS